MAHCSSTRKLVCGIVVCMLFCGLGQESVVSSLIDLMGCESEYSIVRDVSEERILFHTEPLMSQSSPNPVPVSVVFLVLLLSLDRMAVRLSESRRRNAFHPNPHEYRGLLPLPISPPALRFWFAGSTFLPPSVLMHAGGSGNARHIFRISRFRSEEYGKCKKASE